VPGVSQAIEVHESRNLGALNDVLDEVRADEAGAASDEEVHEILDFGF
jgi:hypothetical protein